MSSHRNEIVGYAFGALGIAAFSLTLPLTRLAVAEIDPLVIAFGRAVGAAMAAAVLLVAQRAPLPNATQVRQLGVVALGVVLGFPLLTSFAMRLVPASHGAVTIGLLPLATAMAAALIDRERPSMGFWLTGLAGSTVVISFALWRGGGVLHWADVLLLGAIGAAAVGYTVSAKLARQMGGGRVICWSLVLSGPLFVPPLILVRPDLSQAGWPALTAFAYLILVSQWLGFFAWNKGLAMGGAAKVGQVQLVQPFLSLIAAGLLLGEPMEAQLFGFATLVVMLVAVGKRMPVRRVEAA